ncbi:hypothetical protein PILCRDRAFT_822105 [Piloderma croceum F 1598]|uniref:CS domain-containing protein n=1 Tax=Piloderma croceum (strain F 1598) TaxID=765440 RepID=A0A0C3FNN9_PILCF|nr:hypothetical protein PILCRDRAFT_822105 [Piloderma croceum F 1598]
MITPRFSCSQTAESVVISIYCPSIRASDVEIHVDETLLTVHINPYFLRLNFSNRLLEDDESSAQYDPGSGYLIVTLTKETKGEEFKDLDLLAKLLAPRSTQIQHQPIIEVVGTENVSNDEDDLVERTRALALDRQEILEAAENDWQLPQDVPKPLADFDLSVEKRYGFLDMHSGYFRHVSHMENEVNELGADAEFCSPDERRKRRIMHEDEKFDGEHYMADYMDDESIREVLTWKHPHITNADECQYTEEEKLAMLRLPRREYLATSTQTHDLYLTLLTLLFSYAYDARFTQHDPSTESAWTISALTPAFSALDPPPYFASIHSALTPANDPIFSPSEIASALVPSYRRSLAFPLYRSFALAETCRTDVAELLCKGRRTVVRCLIELKRILDLHEVYYIYSKIWVEDFCVWTQAYATDDNLKKLATCVKFLKMEKSLLGWDLEKLETVTQEQSRDDDSDDETDD